MSAASCLIGFPHRFPQLSDQDYCGRGLNRYDQIGGLQGHMIKASLKWRTARSHRRIAFFETQRAGKGSNDRPGAGMIAGQIRMTRRRFALACAPSMDYATSHCRSPQVPTPGPPSLPLGRPAERFLGDGAPTVIFSYWPGRAIRRAIRSFSPNDSAPTPALALVVPGKNGTMHSGTKIDLGNPDEQCVSR